MSAETWMAPAKFGSHTCEFMNVRDALLESRACEDEVVNATRTHMTKGRCDHHAQHRRRSHHRPPEQVLRSYQKVKQATSDCAKGSQDAVVLQQEDHVAGRHRTWHGVAPVELEVAVIASCSPVRQVFGFQGSLGCEAAAVVRRSRATTQARKQVRMHGLQYVGRLHPRGGTVRCALLPTLSAP